MLDRYTTRPTTAGIIAWGSRGVKLKYGTDLVHSPHAVWYIHVQLWYMPRSFGTVILVHLRSTLVQIRTILVHLRSTLVHGTDTHVA